MSLYWLSEILPAELLSRRTKIFWALFFLLFPLAYIGGVMLERTEESPAAMMRAQDRSESIRKAAEFAATKGESVAGWSQYAIVDTRDRLESEYESKRDTEVQLLSELVPAQEVQVLFRSPDNKHEFRVYLSLWGEVTGFDFGKATTRNGMFSGRSNLIDVTVNNDDKNHKDDDQLSMSNSAFASDHEAESIARAAMSDNKKLMQLVRLGKPDVEGNEDDRVRREVSWDAKPVNHPEVTLHVAVSVRDGQVVAEHITAQADKAAHRSKRWLPEALVSINAMFLTFAAFYAIWRYVKRTVQKEVSHARALIVATLFFVSFSIQIYSILADQSAMRLSAENYAKVGIIAISVAGVLFAGMSLLVGIAYGSGEGALRECYPTKVTSLDAVLAGRPFSKNAAASILFGGAVAGWLLLCQQSIGMLLPHDVAAARSDVLGYTFARLPWLTLLAGKLYDSLLIAVTGLVLPASLLLKGVRKRNWRGFLWLIAFSLLSVLRDAAKFETPEASLVASLILMCALLLPFFAFDLLAAIASLSSLAFISQLAWLSAIFPSWNGLVVWLAAIGGLVLAAAAVLAVRGLPVRDEDVRPTYAKNLAERMSLQAEVSAAREAQLRLLPQTAPKLTGAQIAACCLPAREVGGDFYDFFPLDPNRLGIFVAQGGSEGLASALCIALAKGVLMHDALQSNSPAEIVSSLASSMVELLDGGSGRGISFAYGVLDVRRRTLNYARTGSSPRLVVARAGELRPGAQLERVATLGGRSVEAASIYEGSVSGQPGDLFIFYTHGVTALRVKRFRRLEFQWLDLVLHHLKKQEDRLETALLSALSRKRQTAEDLTAVLVRIETIEAAAQEVVA